MNIIAIMGPHGVFYKDEPIKELESALVVQGFQIIWPQNSVDLLKFIEHNPRICGVIFDWDEYSLDLCSDINQLNEYLPLYAFINTHSTMDVSVQDMRMALWFFEYALGQAEDIAIRMRQYTNEYLDNITPPFTKALFTYVKERKYTFCTPGHMGGTAYQKSPVGCLFYDFFGGNTLKADVSISVTELGSLLDHTGPHLATPGSGRVHRADFWRGTELYRYQRNIDVEQNCGYVRRAIRQYAVDRPQLS